MVDKARIVPEIGQILPDHVWHFHFSNKWFWRAARFSLAGVTRDFSEDIHRSVIDNFCLCAWFPRIASSKQREPDHAHTKLLFTDFQLSCNESCCCWPLLYSAVFRSRPDLLRSCRVGDSKWMTLAYYSEFLNILRSSVLTALFGCYTSGATWNCCHLGARSVYTLQPCSNLHC